MTRKTEQHPVEAKMMKISTGFRGIEDPTTVFTFAQGRLSPEEVLHHLQKGHDAFGRVRAAEVELALALTERERLIPEMKRFCDEALQVAKRHYGGDVQRMARFGVEAVSTPKRNRGKAKRGRSAKRASHCGADAVEERVITVIEEVVVEQEVASPAMPMPKRVACGKRRPERSAKACAARAGRAVR